MVELFLALLRILFPLDPVVRLREVTRFFINRLIEDIATFRAELEASPEARAILEGQIASAEDGLQQLIHERARQIAGLPFVFINRNHEHPPRRSRSMKQVLARLERLLILQNNLERLAHRRAARMRRERDANPLGLADTMMIIRDQHDDRAIIITREVLHRLWRGRWLGASSRRDGGDCAQPRGPPASSHSAIFRAHHLALTCESAPARLPQSLPRRLLKTSGDRLAKSTKREHNREQERSKNMNGAVNFCGANGSSYKFERFGAEQDWAKVAGVVLFAAPEGKSWRVIRVADQGGVEGDVATFWRWREARRYGATAIFIRRNADITARRREAADLAQGLDPVFASGSELAREPELMAA